MLHVLASSPSKLQAAKGELMTHMVATIRTMDILPTGLITQLGYG